MLQTHLRNHQVLEKRIKVLVITNISYWNQVSILKISILFDLVHLYDNLFWR